MGEPAPLTKQEIAYWSHFAERVVEAVNDDAAPPRAAWETGELVDLDTTIFKLAQLALLRR